MPEAPAELVIIFILISILLILCLVVFVTIVIYRYQQKQNAYFKDVEELKTSYENILLKSQLEIQEQTFQNIAREMHDNIGQKLTLAKLHLNTFNNTYINKNISPVNDSVMMISEAINCLSDITRSMSSEIVLNNGLISALENEKNQLMKSGLFEFFFTTSGREVFLNKNAELVIFRIIQEAFTNIVKHARASEIQLNLRYDLHYLSVVIADNGKGFNVLEKHTGTGLQNIKKRTALLKGLVEINSTAYTGTQIRIKIPTQENEQEI